MKMFIDYCPWPADVVRLEYFSYYYDEYYTNILQDHGYHEEPVTKMIYETIISEMVRYRYPDCESGGWSDVWYAWSPLTRTVAFFADQHSRISY